MGDVILSPPSQGAYRGIAIFQDRSADVGVDITGHGSLRLEGAVYAAKAEVKVAGNGDEIASLHISRRLVAHGNGVINVRQSQIAPMGCPK